MARCNGHSKKCKKVDLVHEFINFMCTYEAAMDNSSYVSYISSNLEVMDELSSEGGDYDGINAYVPRTGYEKDEVFECNKVSRKIISDLWSRVKVVASNAELEYQMILLFFC